MILGIPHELRKIAGWPPSAGNDVQHTPCLDGDHCGVPAEALGEPGPGRPAWAALMARMRRKTLIVCAACHDWIHANPVAHAA
jgi:hypothetical protein